MASVTILTEPLTDIDYSVVDGRVRSFELYGEKLYDEDDGIERKGWKQKLIKLVMEQKLNIDKDGRGLHAFIYRMMDDGLIDE